MLLHDRGIRSQVQITGFSLSVCHVRRLVEILYRLDYLRNCFIKNAIRSNVLINHFEILPRRLNHSENRLNAFESRFNALTNPFDFFSLTVQTIWETV